MFITQLIKKLKVALVAKINNKVTVFLDLNVVQIKKNRHDDGSFYFLMVQFYFSDDLLTIISSISP